MDFHKFKVFIVCSLIALLVGCKHSNETLAVNHHSSGYIKVDQGKLFYQSFGKGDPIIVLHGGPGLDQDYLLPQMLELTKDHQVIFYDQRGSGKSLDTTWTPGVINMKQFVQDLETVRKQLGIKKFILLGHSWGGLLGMNYAIQHPENLSALILLDTAPANYQGMQAFEREFIKRTKSIAAQIQPLFSEKDIQKLTQAEIMNLDKKLFSVYLYNPKDIAKLSLNWSADSIKSGVKVMKIMAETSSLKPNSPLMSQLNTLHLPTLILHGKEDIIPISTAKEINAAIPHSKFIAIEECGHFVFIEKSEQTFGYIRNFLIESQAVSKETMLQH